MNLLKAKRIKELKYGTVEHSYRRIAELIEEEFPEHPELSGNQLHGQDLVKEAMALLNLIGEDLVDRIIEINKSTKELKKKYGIK